ncbi:hypothetical protein COU57_02785 [Candidatus Pacearchaeota archaeon CG10_big_fil_rev_8_21_14_0_10_32_14]|nr:MAG: hypothetical protein COU57_02785 [Candidatus Pacearchaeota archaeon CG10_big_fil_rev_8_21_14_0_10_32_14]
MKIIQEKENLLFKRKEIKYLVEGEKTPSRDEAAKIISDNFKSNLENIKIEGIKGKFGRKTFLIDAKIYSSLQDKENIEAHNKKVKK